MIKSFVFFVLVSFFCNVSFSFSSDKFSYSSKVGINGTLIQSNDSSSIHSINPGITVGSGVSYILKRDETLLLRTDVLFSLNRFYREKDEQGVLITEDIDLSYITIPIYLDYARFKIVFRAGLFSSFLINAKSKGFTNNISFSNEVKDDFKSFSNGFIFGLSYPLGRYSFGFDYFRGIGMITKKEDSKSQFGSFRFIVSYQMFM